MANDKAASIQFCALRIARLDADGAPLVGAGNMYVTHQMGRLSAGVELSAGDDFSEKNGCGVITVSLKDCDRLLRLNLGLSLQTPDPQLHELLVGGEVLMDGADVVGYAPPAVGEEACPDGVSIEAWSKAIVDGHVADTNPYWRWVFPRTFWQLGEKVLENGIMQHPLTGFAEQNANWGNGPNNDWDYTSTKLYQWARDAAIPAVTAGSVAIPADVP